MRLGDGTRWNLGDSQRPGAPKGRDARFGTGTVDTATAPVADGTRNVVYVWYLNGVSVGTGSSYTVPATTAAGYYRLDVTAFTADGARGGSASTAFQVTGGGSPATVATALWARTVSTAPGPSAFHAVAVDGSGNAYAAGWQGAGNAPGRGTGERILELGTASAPIVN